MASMARGAAVLAAAGLWAAQAAAAEPREINVTFATFSADYAAYLNAIEKGYYAEEGLKIKITKAGGGVATPALISGTVDLSTSAASAVGAILRGAALKVVYTMAHRPTYQLWSTKPELKTLADLKGQPVGIISRGDTFEFAMRITLTQAHLPQDWVGFTALGNSAAVQAAVASGALPAAILSSGDIDAIKDKPVVKAGHMIVDMFQTVRMPYSGVAVTDKKLAEDPEMVSGFLRGTLKGVRYMRAFPAETIAIVKKYDPILNDHAAEIDYRDVVESLTDDGAASDDEIKSDLAVRLEIMNLPKDSAPPLDKIYDYRPLRAVNAELDKSGWKPSR
jgi:NitT/TauT family transport system substrate-binding protein